MEAYKMVKGIWTPPACSNVYGTKGSVILATFFSNETVPCDLWSWDLTLMIEKKAFGSIQFLRKAVAHYNILHQFEKFLPKD